MFNMIRTQTRWSFLWSGVVKNSNDLLTFIETRLDLINLVNTCFVRMFSSMGYVTKRWPKIAGLTNRTLLHLPRLYVLRFLHINNTRYN